MMCLKDDEINMHITVWNWWTTNHNNNASTSEHNIRSGNFVRISSSL